MSICQLQAVSPREAFVCVFNLCRRPISLLRSSLGCLLNKASSKSRNNRMLFCSLLLDRVTYALKGDNFPVGGLAKSAMR